MTDDLKPCPFCGGEPKIFHHDTKWFGPTWHIECLDDNCGCGTCHHDSAAIAATVWNRRAKPQAAEIARLREALDLLGVALVGHGHTWSPEERTAYDRAVRAINKADKS